MKRGWLVLMLIFMMFVSACKTVTITEGDLEEITTDPTYESSESFFIFGIIGESHVYVNQQCPKGVFQVQTRMSFVDGLLGLITVGIYSPKTVRLWCK
ncbi:Bor family protein [bacterium]|nr:Bor family protein [bacterium]